MADQTASDPDALSLSSAPMRVVVDPPVIAGDTVHFQWTQSEPNPFQSVNAFSFRYEGIELSRFSPALFYEIFLGLQLKVFAAYPTPVEILLPEPVSARSVAFWSAFQEAANVTVAPLADVECVSVWRAEPRRDRSLRKAAVFFGGGKDSTLTTCLLAELYGPDQTLLIQYIGPLRVDAKLSRRMELRQEQLMLRPARESLGVATQRIWTDYQALFHHRGEKQRPNLELYTLGALPALLAWGVALCSFSVEWTAFLLRHESDGSVYFRNRRTRPEMLRDQTAHYRRALGADITVTDLNLLVSGVLAFNLLSSEFSAALEQIVMCTHASAAERWCYACTKCAQYALLCRATGVYDRRFDYDRLFRTAPFFTEELEHAWSGQGLTSDGNARRPASLPMGLFAVFCHLLHAEDAAGIERRLGRDAAANLLLARALFGNVAFAPLERVPFGAVKLLDNDTARAIGRRLAPYAASADHPDLRIPRTSFEYDFRVKMTTPMSRLDHIRDAAPPVGAIES